MSLQISRVSVMPHQKLAFKGDYLLDTGAGNAGNAGDTCKYSGNVAGKGETHTGEQVNLEPTYILKSNNSKEWVANWAATAATIIPKEDKNAKVIAFLPGPSKLNEKGKQEAALTNLGGFKITPSILKKGLEYQGINVKKVSIYNDGHAHNTNIFNHYKDIIQNPQFVGGLNIFPGGGCGGATIRKEGNKFVSTAEERGHELYPRHLIQDNLLTPNLSDKVGRLSVEEYSTSAPAAVRNFAKALGFNDEQSTVLADTKEGRIITQHEIKLKVNDEEDKKQIEALKKTKLFKDLGIDENGNQKLMLLTPDKSDVISEDEQTKGLKVAGTEFFKGIGIILSRFETQNMGTDVFVPTKLAYHLAKALDAKGESGDAVKIVQQTAWENLDDANRKNVVGKPERQRVFIQDLGDPCSLENIKTLTQGKSPKGDGFREVKIPLNAQ